MNLKSPDTWKRLVSSVKDSRQKLKPFRDKRTELIKTFCGSGYGDSKSKPVFLALLTMATNIYVRQLAVRAPTARITSPFAELRPLAKNWSLACADAAKDTHFGVTLRRAVTDSLFSPKAVVKVGLERVGEQETYGETVDMTDPFIRKISFDDYVCDMSARSANLPAYEGDVYYLSKEEVGKLYSAELKGMQVEPDQLSMQDETGAQRAESVSHGQTTGDDSLKKLIALQDIYLPEFNMMATYLVQKPDRALKIIQFDSPEESVYHSLWYTSVPDNAMPLPPFSILSNIHNFANELCRRIYAQAHKHKRLVGFSDEETAKRFSTAEDGTGIHWEGQQPQNIEAGGIDNNNFAMFVQLKDLFSWAAGNLDSLGGLSPMSETLGQDEMLSKSAGAQLADMQDSTAEFARKIFRQIAWYEWTDPIRERVLQKQIPGTDEFIAVDWTPETRQGDFLDFNFDIVAHSMREDSPASKLQKLQGALNQFVLPLMPFMQQQGLTVDVRRMNEIIGDYSNLPELEQIIIPMDPAMSPGGGQGEGPAGNPTPSVKPAQTKRTYERINRPGATRVGKDAALVQTLIGGKPQASERAAMGRPVG